ncbi:MAG TPA: helix-turn-helix transcriptional regulator [Longimicrobiales bacterium]
MAAAGEKIGLSGEAVRRLYRGKSVPSGDTLAAILRAYPRVNPSWLLLGIGPRERPPGNGISGYAAGKLDAATRLFDAAAELLEEAKREAGQDDQDGNTIR